MERISVFSDEDLAELRHELMANSMWRGLRLALERERFTQLLARLEAIEAYYQYVRNFNMVKESKEANDLEKVWLKAKGERLCLDGSPCGEGCGCPEQSGKGGAND